MRTHNWRLVLTRHLLCHRSHHLFLFHAVPRLAQFGSVKHIARAFGATCTGLRVARVASVACVVATQLSPGRASGFCTVHCTSLRCTLHRKRQPVCSSPNGSSLPSPSCVVGSCAVHCSHPQCSRGREDPPHYPRPLGPPRSHSLRIISCNETVHPEFHNLLVADLRLLVCQDSTFLESRMHCPCAGDWLTNQCASVRSVRPCRFA